MCASLEGAGKDPGLGHILMVIYFDIEPVLLLHSSKSLHICEFEFISILEDMTSKFLEKQILWSIYIFVVKF